MGNLSRIMNQSFVKSFCLAAKSNKQMNSLQPLFFHVDMDAFFVSVEEVFDPSLKGKAVVVGGSPDQRGVVSAASYEARKYGVHSAMPLVTAKKLCPHAVFLTGRREKYAEYSDRVQQIFQSYTPVVQMVSIDEAFLDFAGSTRLYGQPFHLAHRLRNEIQEKTGLSASIGIARTKLVAKVASDLAKPRGILNVLSGHEATFLGPLKIGKLPGIGKVAETRLQELGIYTVAELSAVEPEFLSQAFGQWGVWLHRKSIGLDTPHFDFNEEPKSISNEHTFSQDTADPEEIKNTLAHLVQKTAHRLREHHMFCKTITLKLRDLDFHTITRAVSLREPSQLDREILEKVLCLHRENWNGKVKIRLFGVSLSALSYGNSQEHLFRKEERQKMSRLYAAADKVREKFGFQSVSTNARVDARFKDIEEER